MSVGGRASGTRVPVSGGGMVTLTLSPAVTRSDGFTWRPSTETRPSSIRRRAWLRDSSGQRRAMNVSSRSPPRSAVSSSVLISGGLSFRRERQIAEDNRRDRDGKGGVGDVERRIRGEIDEVRHLAQAHAVEEVAGGPAQHHAYGDGCDRVVKRWIAIVEVDCGQPDARHHHQEDRLILEDPESGACVRDVTYAHRPVRAAPQNKSGLRRDERVFGGTCSVTSTGCITSMLARVCRISPRVEAPHQRLRLTLR